MNKESILIKLKEQKSIYEKDGISIIGLFGSFANNKNDKYSDIDIAYSIDYPLFTKKFSDGFSKILKLEDIKNELEALFHKKIDFVSLNSSNKTFIEHIKKELIYV